MVNHNKEGEKLFPQFGISLKSRSLTGYNSGRSGRVVWEWEVSDPGQFDAAFNKAMSNPEAGKAFNTWEARLREMIHYSEVETWAIN